MELAIHKLEKVFANKPILEELGEKARIPLTQVAAFLSDNRESKEWFIFYPEEIPEWAVFADWRVDFGGWDVGVCPVARAGGWKAGGRVVSRD